MSHCKLTPKGGENCRRLQMEGDRKGEEDGKERKGTGG